MRFLAAIAALAMVSGIAMAEADYKISNGVEIQGDIITSIDTSAGVTACRSYCDGNYNCVAFTVITEQRSPTYTSQKCHLMSSADSALDNPNAISGAKIRATGTTTSWDVRTCREGAEYQEFNPQGSAKGCQKACLEDARCRAWNHQTATGERGACALYDGETTTRAYPYCTSGMRN